MKSILLALLIIPVALLAQNIQENPSPQQFQMNVNVNGNVNPQQQTKNDFQINDDKNEQINIVQQDNNEPKGKTPCKDCDEIKDKKKEYYGGMPGTYSGGANKFKRRRAWKRFCYNIAGKPGHSRRSSPNFSVCFNW